MLSIFDFAWLIPLAPLVFFVLILAFSLRDAASSWHLAMYGYVISCVLAPMLFVAAIVVAGERTLLFKRPLLDWFSTGRGAISLGIYIDAASAAMLAALSVIWLVTHIYNGKIMEEVLSDGRFSAVVSLLAACAFGLLVFDNLLLFFVLWEIMDVCAYLLIGFRQARESAFRAGLKAFLVSKTGDACFLLGLAMLYSTTGSFTYGDVFSAENLEALAQAGLPGTQFPVAAVIGLLFFGAVVSKSAQFPLHVWLPEATQAPTPASALIHTATISAGVLLLFRAFPLFEVARDSLTTPLLGVSVVALVGTFTAIFTALVAVAQRDIRRALSWSAASQLGYAVAALGMGARVAGLFHLIASAFVNALLLLAAGSVVRAVTGGGKEEPVDEGIDPYDVFNLGGLSARQPITFWTFLVGGMALAGLPFVTAGFWSKHAVLAQAWAASRVVFWTLALSTGVAALCATRLSSLVFLGPPRSRAAARARESAPAVTTPLVVLAIVVVAIGWFSIPDQFPVIGGNWFASFLGLQEAEPGFAGEPALLGMALSVVGWTLGLMVYGWKPVQAGEGDRLESAMRRIALGGLHRTIRAGFYLDRLYEWIFARGSVWLAEAFRGFDRGFLDGMLVRGTTWLGRGLSEMSDWVEARLCELPDLVGIAARSLARASGIVELELGRPVRLSGSGALVLARLSDAVDREVVDRAVGGVGSAVRAVGAWFRPKTGKAQAYLLLAAAAVLVSVVIFLFLFPQV